MSNEKVILKSDCQEYVEEFIQDANSLVCEWNHNLQFCQLLDTAEQVQQEIKNLTSSKLYHLKTMTREYIYKTKTYTFALVCFVHPSELLEDHLALAFNYIISAHVILLKNHCFVCKKTNSKLCSRCNLVFYCSRECQLIDRSVHKEICKKPQRQLNHNDNVDE